MGTFLIRRTIQIIIVLFAVMTLMFGLLRLSGDPVALLVGDSANPEQVVAMRKALGLDEPILFQYVRYIVATAHFDFGDSLVSRRDALRMVFDVLPNTLLLSASALLLGLAVAFPVGIYAALHRRNVGSFFAMLLALLGQSVPSFWLGIMLILVFAVQFRWLPSFGTGSWRHLVLPTIALSAFIMARQARLVRSGMLEVMNQDYIRTARAKGLPGWLVIGRHALKNMLLPIVTVIGIDLSFLLGGAVIVETVFAWPGMGRQMIHAVISRDYPVVQATVFVVAVMVVMIQWVIDLAYAWLDPRVRVE